MSKGKKEYAPNPDLPRDVRKELEAAIRRQAAGKAMVEEGERMVAQAKGLILPTLMAFESDTYMLDGVGRVNVRSNKGSAINGPRLREALVLRGVDPGVVEEAVEEATKRWETAYIEFKTQG